MSSILLNMIHKKAEATHNPLIEITASNYGIWVKHWFECAEEIAVDFEHQGLPNTTKAVRDIIIEQMKHCRSYFNETQSPSSTPSAR